jgi:arginyl-tRNA synthetase
VNQTDPVTRLHETITQTARTFAGDESLSPSLEVPPKAELGDYSSNAAMLMAKVLGRAPRDIAAELSVELAREFGPTIEKTEVAGPGFINFFLADSWYRQVVGDLTVDGTAPVPPVADPEKILIEFVSANPTGPLTAASGRHAAYGDALSRLLKATANFVTTEYYVNDGGSQVESFAASIAARMTGGEPPENGYHGDYVNELAERAVTERIEPTDLGTLALSGVEWMVDGIRASLVRFGVEMDDFFSERSLYEGGLVDRELERLRVTGNTFEDEGALWLRTTDFGDDKDRVLVRSGGEPTYFGADVAYHADKIERGYSRLVDVWGADHHGYVARMAAAIKAFDDGVDFEVQILQMIHLVEGGQRTKMSKRAGDIVTLDELVDDIGTDAARFFLLQRSHDSTFDLDLDLARSQSSDNPVYYVQYAHARIRSILRRAEEEGLTRDDAELTEAPVDPSEKALIAKLLAFPAEVHEAAERRAPHRICAYASQVAAAYHAFYRDCQVIGAEGEGVQAARLNLCEVTGKTIRSSLGLLGISAPDRM